MKQRIKNVIFFCSNRKKISNYLWLICFLFTNHASFAQNFGCAKEWTPGGVIGFAYRSASPRLEKIYSRENSVISFVVRFSDLDFRVSKGNPSTCSNANLAHQYPYAKCAYKVNFSCKNSLYASFQSLNSGIIDYTVDAFAISDNSDVTGIPNSLEWNSKLVKLYINDDWKNHKQEEIVVSVQIEDVSILPTSPDSGSPQDPSIKLYEWHIKYSDKEPETLDIVSTMPIPAENIWIPNKIKISYKAKPDINNDGIADYANHLIREDLKVAEAEGLLQMSYFEPNWLTMNSITNVDAAAAILFPSYQGSTFVIDDLDLIRDNHAGFFQDNEDVLVEKALKVTITPISIGYARKQNYLNMSSLVLKSATISRKVNVSVKLNPNGEKVLTANNSSLFIKKTHN